MKGTLSYAISAYRTGLKAYADKDGATPQETYQTPHDALAAWDQPATSTTEVYEVLRLLKEEGCSELSEVAQSMLTAALAYFEHRSSRAA